MPVTFKDTAWITLMVSFPSVFKHIIAVIILMLTVSIHSTGFAGSSTDPFPKYHSIKANIDFWKKGYALFKGPDAEKSEASAEFQPFKLQEKISFNHSQASPMA